MNRQRGFTLVELLVVISIIGMLVALLLPAVNSAREQGRITTCKNNLHQLGTACMEHVNKIGCFPSGGWGSGWVGLPDQGYSLNQPGGWIYQLLPYMDQDALHDLGKGNLSLTNSASAKRVSTALPALYCPTRRAGVPYPISGPGASPQSTTAVTQAGRSDYVANGGTNAIMHGSGPGSAPVPASYTWPSLATFNGLISVHSAIPFASVPDNKDTCYLFGEKYMSPENYVTGVDSTGVDTGDANSAMSGDDVSLIRWGNTTLLPAMDRVPSNGSARPQTPSQIFGSSHSAGWNVVFVGGNVQLIGWGINPTLHGGMCTRNGHEVIDPSLIPK